MKLKYYKNEELARTATEKFSAKTGGRIFKVMCCNAFNVVYVFRGRETEKFFRWKR